MFAGFFGRLDYFSLGIVGVIGEIAVVIREMIVVNLEIAGVICLVKVVIFPVILVIQ